MTEKPYTDGGGTTEDVRQTMRGFYEKASRDEPDYFPADESTEKEYNTSQLMPQRDIQGGRVTFESEPGPSQRISIGKGTRCTIAKNDL
nr:hypothetical protein [Halorubrum sp. SP9]